jgi:hypothetical protein
MKKKTEPKVSRVYILVCWDNGDEYEKEIRTRPGLNKLADDTGIVGQMIDKQVQ